MPTPTKTLGAMTKHLTAEEAEARDAAEQSVATGRQVVSLNRPTWLTGRGKKYWDSILDRMAGTAILDDLDAEVLAIYCAQLAERDALQSDLKRARTKREGQEPDMELILALTKQLNAKDAKIKDFASELGCTPSGRVRLAQRRSISAAAAEAGDGDPNGDLFGD